MLTPLLLAGCQGGRTPQATIRPSSSPSAPSPTTAASVAGQATAGAIPELLDPHDVYAADRPGMLSATARQARPLVYVPNDDDATVSVVDPATYKVLRVEKVGRLPQHVTPSYDLKTLWVDNDQGNSLTPIDPRTGTFGKPVPVTDPYNLYFTADGRYAWWSPSGCGGSTSATRTR